MHAFDEAIRFGVVGSGHYEFDPPELIQLGEDIR